MVGRGWCFQVCTCSELQFGGLREDGGTREAGSTVAESLVVLYQVGTHQIRRRRRAARSLTSQGLAEPLCARIESANRKVSEGKLISDHGHFFFYEGHMERRTGKIHGTFSRMHRALGGWMLARAPASPTRGLHHHGPRYFNFFFFLRCVALSNLELLIKTGWNVFIRFVAENTGRGQATTIRVDRGCSRYGVKEV